MSFPSKQGLVVARKMLILALSAAGGFLAGSYPAEFAAFCSRVLP